jgi:hypothetical protein
LPLKRRLAKPALVLVAFAVLALALSACAVFKEGSLKLSQPGEIGSVRVHFELCTAPEGEPETCAPNEDNGQGQYVLAISVPKGAVAPATITAVPVAGGAPIVYTRNDQVAQTFSEVLATDGVQWPPAGHDGVGYLSAVFTEEEGETRKWTVDADFGLPAAADGGSFAGPFGISIGTGWRQVNESQPADRPVKCWPPDISDPPEEDEAICFPNEEGKVIEIGTSDLKIAAPPQGSAYVGGQTTLAFPLDFASTATTLPSFNLNAASTLPGATLVLPSPTFAPGTPVPLANRSPAGDGAVVVTVPKTAKPGTYDVTLTATTATGGTVSQVAKLQVSKPRIRFGKVKLNKAKGTAILFVKVPAAGTLTVAGRKVAKAKRQAKGVKTLKVPIKPKGKAKGLLTETGKAKVKAKVTYKPSSGASVSKSKAITLKKNLAG